MSTTKAEAPDRTLEQRRDALVRANEARSARARLKVDVKARRVSAADVIADPPELIEGMKVVELLLAVPKVGRVRVDKRLRVAGISPSKTVGGLTGRQRLELTRWHPVRG
jgi:hypothetical protein